MTEKEYKRNEFWGNVLWWFCMILFILAIFAPPCKAQLTLKKTEIIFQADTMEVKQAFKLLNYMVTKNQKITKTVIKDGKEYYQSKYLINRLLKNYAYFEKDGKVKLRRL